MDTFLLENPIWKVLLNNNEVIISDNSYINDESDWIRLKKYCKSNNLHIESMWIIFRDNIKLIEKGQYYFFRRMSLSRFGKIDRREQTYQYFIVGSTNNLQSIHLKKYLVPELTLWEEEDRILDFDNLESLI